MPAEVKTGEMHGLKADDLFQSFLFSGFMEAQSICSVRVMLAKDSRILREYEF